MSRSKHVMKRRQLLRCLGAAAFLGTPVFRAALSEAAPGQSPLRFIIIQVSGGAWFYDPGDHGEPFGVPVSQSSFTFEKNIAPLAPLRGDLLMLDNIGNLALPAEEGHSMQSLLTGDSRGHGEENHFFPEGLTSIDQIIAQGIGGQTFRQSVQLGVLVDNEVQEAGLTARRMVYNNGLPVQPVTDPATATSQLFAGLGAAPEPMTPSGTLSIKRQSILDLHKAEIEAIKAIAARSEHAKLDEHLTALRELERSVTVPQPMAGLSCAKPGISQGGGVDALIPTMNEILYQTINCDIARVATLQILNTLDILTDWSFLGVNRGHHEMQHDPAADFDKVQTWIWSQVAALITRFKETPDGEGSLLDNCAILVLSEQANSARHMGSPTLGFVAGRGGGAIATGRALDGKFGALNNLYVALANTFGINVTSVGEPQFNTGALSLG